MVHVFQLNTHPILVILFLHIVAIVTKEDYFSFTISQGNVNKRRAFRTYTTPESILNGCKEEQRMSKSVFISTFGLQRSAISLI